MQRGSRESIILVGRRKSEVRRQKTEDGRKKTTKYRGLNPETLDLTKLAQANIIEP
jgi:hypothetical protein